jgi:hypothetical protein
VILFPLLPSKELNMQFKLQELNMTKQLLEAARKRVESPSLVTAVQHFSTPEEVLKASVEMLKTF